jgi:hypothetical protein
MPTPNTPSQPPKPSPPAAPPPAPPKNDPGSVDTPPSPPPNFDPPKDVKPPKPGERDWVQGAPESDEEASKTEDEAKKKLAAGQKVYEARDKALGLKKPA